MPRTILTDFDGFTPVIDEMARQHGLVRAAVFGRIWRYCQMTDGACSASLETIADGLGVDKATVLRHATALEEDGYISDLTPDARNRPHIYTDTGKASILIGFKAGVTGAANETVAQRNATVAQRNATVAQRNATVAESQLKILSKIEPKKDFEETPLKAKIEQHLRLVYNGTYAAINPTIAVDDILRTVTIGVDTDQPGFKAQVTTFMKSAAGRGYKVKVIKLPAVTSGDTQAPLKRAEDALNLAYKNFIGGGYVESNESRAALKLLAGEGVTEQQLLAVCRDLKADKFWRNKISLKAVADHYSRNRGKYNEHTVASSPASPASCTDQQRAIADQINARRNAAGAGGQVKG
jgi:predicted ArsR family transcriptional regulator